MTSHRFVTVKKSDPLFSKYLWGQSENGARPIPIETLNLGSPEETVTFEFLAKNKIQIGSIFSFISNLIKLNTFILILMPLFFILTKNFVEDRFKDPFSIFLSAIAMIFLYAGLNIRNDVVDHLSGFDRVNLSFAPKPILKGWLAARTASTISWILIGISFVIALPVFILQQELIRVVGTVLILFFLGPFLQKNSYKQNWKGELILFLLVGPALVAGYQVSLGAGIDTQSLAFGILWGFASLFLIHINNFSHLLTSSQAKIKNTMTQMGFDRAKTFLIIWWGVFLLLWIAFHWFYSSYFWLVTASVLLIAISVPLLLKMKRIQSPVGSELRGMRKASRKVFLGMVFILVIENFSALGAKFHWTL